jgi:hypothetical protein
MSAKKIAQEIAEGLREQGFEVDEVDAWPVSDYYLYVSGASGTGGGQGYFRLTTRGEVFDIWSDADKPIKDAVKDMGFKIKKDHKRTIFVAYEIVTPESAEEGDVEDRGEEAEEEIIPSYDDTFASAATAYLRTRGARPSGGDWFETGFEVSDYGTGAEENHSFHLRGFTDEEENMIWTEMERKR